MKKKNKNNLKLILYVIGILLLTAFVFCAVAIGNADSESIMCDNGECAPLVKMTLSEKFFSGLENMFGKTEIISIE